MARIAGIDLPNNKRVEIGLTYVFGIGRSTSIKILAQCEIDKDIKVRELTEDQVRELRSVIEAMTVEGDLRRQTNMDIKRLLDLGNFRGIRHRKGLPCRGQRTKTNARTRKGPKKLSVGRKKK